MKRIFIIGLFTSVIIFSCSQNKKPPQHTLPVQKAQKKVSMNLIGGIQFTKSYSFMQSSLRSDKEKDKLFEETEKSNPYYIESRSDSILKPLFQNLGIVKGDELLLSKFKYSNRPDTAIKSFSGKEIRFLLKKDTTGNTHAKIIAFFDGDSADARPTFHQQVQYAFLDMVPGRNKEIVVLTEDYLMNTFIYTFEVFEIKIND